MQRFLSAACALLIMPFVVGCSDSDPVEPRTDVINVATDLQSATVDAGSSSTVQVTVTRPEGFAGPVSLTVDNLPEGVTGVFTPAILDAEATLSTLTLTADAAAPSATGSVTLRAVGADLESQSALLTVVVGAGGAPTGSFALSVAPGNLSLPRLGTGSVVVAIDRLGGYSAGVALAVGGLPPGVFVAITPGMTSGGSATITLTLDSSVLPGSYTGTVTAAGEGAPPQTAVLTLTVTPN
ncbi:MAG: hypothetical protein ACO1Q7_18755 [Gemmatimonas sp.]